LRRARCNPQGLFGGELLRPAAAVVGGGESSSAATLAVGRTVGGGVVCRLLGWTAAIVGGVGGGGGGGGGRNGWARQRTASTVAVRRRGESSQGRSDASSRDPTQHEARDIGSSPMRRLCLRVAPLFSLPPAAVQYGRSLARSSGSFLDQEIYLRDDDDAAARAIRALL
jgi:hypothetical protein